jgi:putative redox protein
MAKIKTVFVAALNPAGANSSSFIAQNPRGDRSIITAHKVLPISNDPPSAGLGPMEALLAALGSCTAVDVQDIMAKRRTPLTRYRLEIEGSRAEGTPGRYTSILVRHIGSGEGVSAEQLEKAAHLSHEKYCSVAASLREDIVWSIEARVE